MSATATTARRLLEQTGRGPVVSLFFDLDPARFATAPARATQLRSLLDDARRQVTEGGDLDHDERVAVEQDLARIEQLLGGDQAPVSGARSLAVFASGQAGVLETVALPRPLDGRVVIARRPVIEPLVAGSSAERWAVVLVSRRRGRIFAGSPAELGERRDRRDDTHGRHQQGGWSQARYERSYEAETDAHLRDVAAELERLWQQERFTRILVGGPEEIAARFREACSGDVRPRLAPGRLAIDVDTASAQDIEAALAGASGTSGASDASGDAEQPVNPSDAAVLGELEEALGQQQAVIGIGQTLDALNQRRARRLILDRSFAATGRRCPLDGLLYAAGTDVCPSDGNPTEASDLREALVEAAVLQDADLAIVGEGNEVPAAVLVRGQGVAALLRF